MTVQRSWQRVGLRAVVAGIGVLAVLLAEAILAPPVSGQTAEGPGKARIAGANRFDTAARISAQTHETAATVHVVAGADFPDALAAAYAAGATNGPVLLVGGDHVPGPTWGELERLEAERAVLVGGEQSIGPTVQAELAAAGYETDRIAGGNRYQTASAVALRYGLGDADAVGTMDGERTALLASGAAFPDALTAGPIAAAEHFPLLLTPPDEPEPSAEAAFEQLDIERVVVVGGPAAVSGEVVAHYEDAGYAVERWAGASRTDTAAVVADQAVERLGFSPAVTLLARGDDFPDALTASAHAAALGAPLLLTADPTTLGSPTGGWLVDACPAVDVVTALGGIGAVSAVTLSEAVSAAGTCREAEEANQDYLIAPQETVVASIGGDAEFELLRAMDHAEMDAIEMALFPCSAVDFSTSRITFTDRGDGFAAGAGETDNDEAWISHINGHPQGTTEQRRDRAIEGPGQTWTVTSEALDCAVVVVWGIGSANELQLPVDDDGEPTVNFGIGVVEFVDDHHTDG